MEQVFSSPTDVESLVSGGFKLWWDGLNHTAAGWGGCSPSLILSNQSFQHTGVENRCQLIPYSAIPRRSIVIDPAEPEYLYPTIPWVGSYQAISAVAQGLRALQSPEVSEAMDPDRVQRLRAYGKFVQGLAHGTVALLYDRGFIVDEATDATERGEPVEYSALLEAAFGYFDEAMELANEVEFTIPFQWMRAEPTSQDLIRLIRSFKARFRAQVARTPEERASVDWASVAADVDEGLQSTFTINQDWTAGWSNSLLMIGPWPYNSAFPYFIYGMADQSGAMAEWYALDLGEKHPILPDGRPFLIVTPDLRFPRGSTVEEQRAGPGEYFRLLDEGEYSNWWFSSRGTWRWSWYVAGPNRGYFYYDGDFDQPEILLQELRLLKAEGLYRLGDLGGAAAIVNETRTLHGLSPTDASGTNTSCVPRLPSGECGNLWEMLKWEKRMEVTWTGIAGANWFFDGRGWGDLWKDTPLQFPVPCTELEVLMLSPCYTFGGAGGTMGADVSTYRFPGEEG